MDIWITGGGFITGSGFGKLSEGKKIIINGDNLIFPATKDIFSRPLTRYGRFDDYTRLGCATIALTLQDANFSHSQTKQPIGIISSSQFECFETDISYYQTTLEQDGLLSSPNLFSYTLPGIMLGECALYFGLTGPTFSVCEQQGIGMAALKLACLLMATNNTNKIIAGWVDSITYDIRKKVSKENQNVNGSVFVMMETEPELLTPYSKNITFSNGKILGDNGKEINSIIDLFSV